MKPTFFKTRLEFRKWLERHHETAQELLVGFYKKGSGRPSMTWPESVDEALCFGWIDSIRKSLDEVSYTIRFTPRKPGSVWSGVNTKRAEELVQQELMRPAGLRAYEARRENRSGIYSYEQRSADLEEPYRGLLEENAAAWAFFREQPPSYRKAVGWWVVSAKREETRIRRLEKLATFSALGKRLPEFTLNKEAL
jgi:uncharacterized protein YdeI (YjbR/CyaY-like superfamily)